MKIFGKEKDVWKKISEYANKKSGEEKEYKKIPKDYWLDLNAEDYQKWKDSRPQGQESWLILTWISAYIKVFFFGFIIYAISDFMRYILLKVFLLVGALVLIKIFWLGFVVCFFLDLGRSLATSNAHKKHKIAFYNRLKKKRK